jgi:hypothetical protein
MNSRNLSISERAAPGDQMQVTDSCSLNPEIFFLDVEISISNIFSCYVAIFLLEIVEEYDIFPS